MSPSLAREWPCVRELSVFPLKRGCLFTSLLVVLAYAGFMSLETAYMFHDFHVLAVIESEYIYEDITTPSPDDVHTFAERGSEYAHENNTTSSPWSSIPPSLSEVSHQASIGTRWTTLLDGSVSPRAFKRHMFTKHQNGNIAWLEMSVLATPSAPEELLTWAKDLGVTIHPIPSLTCDNTTAPASQRHHMARVYAWCLTGGGPIVFTRAHTLILRDLRQFESQCGSDAAFCGPVAFRNLPKFEIDSGIFMARPHEAHCQALSSMAENSTQHPKDCEKGLLNSYFVTVNRTVLDSRYNAVLRMKKSSVQPFANAIIAQYEPSQEARLKREEGVRDVLESIDRAFDRFEAVRAGRIPRRVIYATILTPAPKGHTHSTTPEAFKAHHVSKFVNGKIPWENHAIIYTENAFPEYRAWLKARGGHTIEVPPLFCENGRDKRYKYQFTKLQMWNLTEWDTIVYTDLDTLVTGDISQLWQSCPDGVNLCGAAESHRFPRRQYINGGLMLARPNREFYQDLIEGRETYEGSMVMCEQDYLNYFLTEQRIGIVDPKYNIMSFDMARTIPYEDARLIHSKKEHENGLKFAVTEEDRSFIDRERKRIARLVSDFD